MKEYIKQKLLITRPVLLLGIICIFLRWRLITCECCIVFTVQRRIPSRDVLKVLALHVSQREFVRLKDFNAIS
jgi:hypothetical protein